MYANRIPCLQAAYASPASTCGLLNADDDDNRDDDDDDDGCFFSFFFGRYRSGASIAVSGDVAGSTGSTARRQRRPERSTEGRLVGR